MHVGLYFHVAVVEVRTQFPFFSYFVVACFSRQSPSGRIRGVWTYDGALLPRPCLDITTHHSWGHHHGAQGKTGPYPLSYQQIHHRKGRQGLGGIYGCLKRGTPQEIVLRLSISATTPFFLVKHKNAELFPEQSYLRARCLRSCRRDSHPQKTSRVTVPRSLYSAFNNFIGQLSLAILDEIMTFPTGPLRRAVHGVMPAAEREHHE